MGENTIQVAYKVKYENDLLNDSFDSLEFLERIDGGWTMAAHRFSATGKTDGQEWIEQINSYLSGLGQSDFKFWICNLSESIKLLKQSHIVIPWKERVVVAPSTASYTVYTIEKRASMHFKPVFTMRPKGKPAIIADPEGDDMVAAMIQETAGLMVATKHYRDVTWNVDTKTGKANRIVLVDDDRDKLIEKTNTPQSLMMLHQPGWTNHDFILSHLIPRSVNEKGEGGYCLFSNEGYKVAYCTPTYLADTRTPFKEQILWVEETQDMWNPTRAGAESLGLSFDPFKLKAIPSDKPEAPTGDVFGGRFNWYSSTDDVSAISVMDAASSKRPDWCERYLQVALHGDEILGTQGFPFKLDLSGTKYKKSDGQQGYAILRHHKIINGKYQLTITIVQG